MLTNIDIDETLVAEAMKVSGARTKREVVDRALRDMVARANRPRLRDLWGFAGEDGFWPDYDPKGSPGEPPGIHRVEEPRIPFGASPAPAPARKAAPARTPKSRKR